MREIIIDREKNEVIMTSKFSKKADDPRTEEFRLLQEVKAMYPTFKVRNHTIKKNPKKECYKGLNYDFMRSWISAHEPLSTRQMVLAELEDKIFNSKCHSKGFRYPTIKKWFLEKYPDVYNFGREKENEDNQIAFDFVA